MIVAFRRTVRRWPPYGCLLGGLAGVILVTAIWPTVALAREWLWIAGVVVGAAGGVLIQGLVRVVLLLAGERPRQARRATAGGRGQRRGAPRATQAQDRR
jgi:hypothetical protein